ncbi:MAG: acyl carrier protein [Rhodospirillaceae bacterium BRH_c57]|nr:MAG: acyl carrier protein [Rhodospirillaceae bacterium BRH_c57]
MVNREVIISVFREVFQLGPDVDVPTLTYRGIPEWDSVGHMQLVAALETALDVMLETDEIIDMSSFDKAEEILARHAADA